MLRRRRAAGSSLLRRLGRSENVTGWALVEPGRDPDRHLRPAAGADVAAAVVPEVRPADARDTVGRHSTTTGSWPTTRCSSRRSSTRIVYTALFVPGTMLVGLFVAAAMNRSLRFISVYRTTAYITMAVSTISQGIIFLWLTDRDYGLVNAALNVGRHLAAAVPGLAVAGAVRDRGDDDLGLDRILGHRVSRCAAGSSARTARGRRDRRRERVHPVPHHHRAAARAREPVPAGVADDQRAAAVRRGLPSRRAADRCAPPP